MKKIYLLLLCVSSFFIACEKDEIISEPEATLAIEQGIEKITFKELPANVSKYFEEKKNLGNLKTKAGNLFGEAKKNQPVIKITNKNRVVSYTIVLTKKENSINKGRSHLYFDNLVVKDLPGEEELVLIFRYEPDESWFTDPQRSSSTYSGKIRIFGLEGNMVGNIDMLKGKLAGKKSYKESTTVDCIWEFDYEWCWYNSETGEFDDCSYHYKKTCTTSKGSDGGSGGEPGIPPDDSGWGDGGEPTSGGGGDSGSGDDSGVDTAPNLPENPDVPCPGDPINEPTIAPSGGWNVQGGRYGWTRKSGEKFHDGIDIKADPWSVLFSMHKGKVVDLRDSLSAGQYLEDSYGNYITIESTMPNGEIIRLKYNHLNTVGVKLGDIVRAGFVIGCTGNTGNAQTKNDVIVIDHVHIQAKVKNNGSWQGANPENYMSTKFNNNGTVDESVDPCN